MSQSHVAETYFRVRTRKLYPSISLKLHNSIMIRDRTARKFLRHLHYRQDCMKKNVRILWELLPAQLVGTVYSGELRDHGLVFPGDCIAPACPRRLLVRHTHVRTQDVRWGRFCKDVGKPSVAIASFWIRAKAILYFSLSKFTIHNSREPKNERTNPVQVDPKQSSSTSHSLSLWSLLVLDRNFDSRPRFPRKSLTACGFYFYRVATISQLDRDSRPKVQRVLVV